MPLFITVPFWVSRIHDCANDLWFILYTIYYRDTLALPLFNLTNIHGLKNNICLEEGVNTRAGSSMPFSKAGVFIKVFTFNIFSTKTLSLFNLFSPNY